MNRPLHTATPSGCLKSTGSSQPGWPSQCAGPSTIADLRDWVTGWYNYLALRLVADLTDGEVPDDL
jgi:hypothetical protein